MTKIHRSAPSRSSEASRRFPSSTESMSGASKMPIDGHIMSSTVTVTASRLVPAPPSCFAKRGSTRSDMNQARAAGEHTTTGRRVVGRTAPDRDTLRSSSEFTRVDLPEPVDPPTTTSRGASASSRRGSTRSCRRRSARSASGRAPWGIASNESLSAPARRRAPSTAVVGTQAVTFSTVGTASAAGTSHVAASA